MFVLALLAMSAAATPIKPDIRKLLEEQQKPQVDYPPARAGWNGPELEPPAANLSPSVLLALDSELRAEAARRTLIAAAIPDPALVGVLLLLILVLRRLYGGRHPKLAPVEVMRPRATPDELQKAA